MHDNRRQFIFYFGQDANVFDILAFNTQPIRENQVADRNSRSRIFAQIAIVYGLKPTLAHKFAIHRIGKWGARLTGKVYLLTFSVSTIPRPAAPDNRGIAGSRLAARDARALRKQFCDLRNFSEIFMIFLHVIHVRRFF